MFIEKTQRCQRGNRHVFYRRLRVGSECRKLPLDQSRIDVAADDVSVCGERLDKPKVSGASHRSAGAQGIGELHERRLT